MKKGSLSILVTVAATLMTGCVSQPQYLKMHADELKPGESPALVKPAAAIRISSVDGKKFEIYGSGKFAGNEYELEFLPGHHRLEVGFSSGTHYSEDRPLLIYVESGRKYVIRPVITGQKWRPLVIDVTTRPQCWTVKVGTSLYGMPLGPEGCDE